MTKEGVGETSGQTAGSYFGKLRFPKPVRQKKREISSFGAEPFWFRNFTGGNAQVKSGPDVFADPLVPAARAVRALAAYFPKVQL
ncbi:hypothetical protein [Bradyrhizobium sp. ISRA463]|uniref:hypothetical protein n=1 Tax=Bradyrhizobium sp. ISRA463 TaxID=2866199 RepID=UPI00247B1456|nr:hypothetical protein [Bradyrhizobium sp. ISRA463]WGS23643.1 hypothetical protein MTX22_19700 [Bradyrhizobium sp. ISRA463]